MKKTWMLLLVLLLVGCGGTGDAVPGGTKHGSEIAFGEMFAVGEVMEITLDNYEWCEEVLPSNTEGSYSYSSDEEGEIYLVLRGKLKNLSTQTLDIQYAGEAQFTINGKYKATGLMRLEENDGTSFYGKAKPLQTLNFVVSASISDELYSQWETVRADFCIADTEERLGYYFDEEQSHQSFFLSFAK